MNSKNYNIYIAFIIWILFSVLALITFYSNFQNKKITDRVDVDFIAEVVDLSQIDTFDWDRIAILSPYSSFFKVEKENNLYFSSLDGKRIDNIKKKDFIDEWMYVFIFIKDRKGVKFLDISRRESDFDIQDSLILDRNDAVFIRIPNSKTYQLKN